MCDKCGKPIELKEKSILDGENEGVYHTDCANEILGIEVN